MGALFLLAGIYQVLDWQGSVHQLCDGLSRMASFTTGMPKLETFVITLLPWGPTLLGIAIFFLLLGGLLVFFGIKTRFGAFLLILFIIPATAVFHAFWLLPPEERPLQMAMFMKNLAIFGGLLTLLALGNGGPKKDGSKKPKEE